jgi:hypothetical protein
MSDLKELFSEFAKAKAEAKKLQEETPKGQALKGVKERLKENNEIGELLEVFVEKKAQPKQVVKEIIKEIIVEKEVTNKDSFQQPAPQPVDPNIAGIIKKMQFLEQAIGRIAAHGPGGGAGDVVNLDHQTTLVTTPTYTVGRKDYYVGIDYAGTVTITLPTNVKNGRYVIIKDESGRCSKFPIIVLGNVDNDPNGFILKVDNGGIQMIYRDGWRIV